MEGILRCIPERHPWRPGSDIYPSSWWCSPSSPVQAFSWGSRVMERRRPPPSPAMVPGDRRH